MKKEKGLKKKIVFNLIVIVLLLFVIGFSARQVYVLTARKADTIINVTGSAQVLNTPNYLYFTGYNANVTLNNDTHEFAGYAWSTDVGWVAFGAADNPDGPVTFDATSGAVSGKARVLDTGADIDFNAAPYNSNVLIHSDGSFTGYAWSTDVGWLDFSGVTAPGVALITSISVSPNSVTLYPGDIQTFTAIAYDNLNNPIPGTTFIWSIVAGGGAIDNSGNFTTGSTTGTFANTVRASAYGVNGFASATINPVPVPPTPIPTPTATLTSSADSSQTQIAEKGEAELQIPKSIIVGKEISFDASGLYGYVSYHWDFGDGNQADGLKVIHKYEEVDRYTVVLILKDESGVETKKTYTIDVLPPVPELTKIDTQKTNVILEGKSFRRTEVIIVLHSDPYETNTGSNDNGIFNKSIDFKETKLAYGDHTITLYAQKKISDELTLKSDSRDYDAYFNLNDNGDLEAEVKQLKRERLLMIMGFILASLLITVIIILFLVRRLKNKK